MALARWLPGLARRGRLAHPRRTADQDVLVARDESAGDQFLDQGAVDPRGGREVKVGQTLLAVTPGLGKAHCQAGLAAALQLVVEEEGQEFNGRQLSLRGLRGPHIEGQQHARQSELA